jgi:hypothetical protein
MHDICTIYAQYMHNICTIYAQYMHDIYVKLTTDNTTSAGINYTELYYCKLDKMTLTNSTLCTGAFEIL